MPLSKSKGNMYDWVTHMHTHLGGKCPHECSYCYVQKNRFGVPARYKGAPRLLEEELNVDYGRNRTIFIEHMNDMFAEGIEFVWQEKILKHCQKFPSNTYVFQTKNPMDAFECFKKGLFPEKFFVGTTIETNRIVSVSKAPKPLDRALGMRKFRDENKTTFLTIEPIMDFDVDEMMGLVKMIQPSFINIGADSKHSKLPEPQSHKVQELIDKIWGAGFRINKKSNLARILE